jgi:glycosyltransferase involved in cell wall biosynthesis
MPKITIGLMVYNEEKDLEEAIESIYEQEFEDLEILIGNNASTDNSSNIIESYAKKDSRIVHINRKNNIGALQNWNDLVDRAKGEYFVLAGGHDKWSKKYLSKLSEALDNNTNAVLSYTKTTWIDMDGNEIKKLTPLIDTSGSSYLANFAFIMFSNQHYLMGMIRTKDIHRTRKQLEIIGSGEIFLQELVQLGNFIIVENERWYRRMVRAPENIGNQLDRYKRILFSSKFTEYRFCFLPHLQMMLVYFYLPFTVNISSWKRRLILMCFYPLIFIRLIFPTLHDVNWCIKKLLKAVFR